MVTRDRRATLGASEIAAVVGVDEYRTADDVWRAKVEGVETPDNEHMVRGRCLEAGLLDWWEHIEGVRLERRTDTTERDPRQRFVLHPNGWASATLDGLAEDGRVVEVKCPVGGKSWDDRKGVCPLRYVVQVQWQLGVCLAAGLPVTSGVLAAGPLWGRLMRFPVTADAALFAGLLAKGEEFMNYVRRREPLPPSFTSPQAAENHT